MNDKERKNIFTQELAVPTTKQLVNFEDSFLSIYNSFLEYLTTIDFSFLRQPKVNKANYKSTRSNSFNENIQELEKYLPTIENYLIQLSEPKYLQILNNLEIPDRSNADSLSVEKLRQEEYNIRLRYYVRELVNSYQVSHNQDIRNHYIKLSTYILREYDKSQPKFGENGVHFRFKATKGLIIKLAGKILYERQFFSKS